MGGEGAAGPSPRKIYVRHGAQTWVRARERYLAGRTAGQVAAELGCSVSAVRLQASRGGWTRRDAAAGEGVGGAGGKGVGGDGEGAAEADGAGAAGSAPARRSRPGPALGPALGEGRFDPPVLPCARPDGRAEHLRLSLDAWAVIRGERLAGASIAALAAKWKVAQGTIRRHAGAEGWTNTDRGEAVSRAMVEATVAERAFAEGRAAAEREAAARAEGEADEADADEVDPLEAARTLLRRAAAAAVAGRLAQAQGAVKLAEGLARAASALGLGDGEDDDAWDEAPKPRLTPEQLEALRDDVERRYARFDSPDAEATGAPAADADGAGAEPDGARNGAQATAAAAAGQGAEREAPAEARPSAAPAQSEPPRAPPPEPPPRGLSRPPRPISVSSWPAWAPPPDAWPRSGRSG